MEANAPEWWKSRHGKKSGKKSTQAQAAKDDSSGEESAAIANHGVCPDQMITTLSDRLADGYMSCIASDTPDENVAVAHDDMAFHFDTGATSHISPCHTDFINFTPITPRSIRGVNGSAIPALGIGQIKLQCGKGRNLTLKKSLFAPQATMRLISVGSLGDDGYNAIFTATGCQVKRGSKTIADGSRKGRNLYRLTGNIRTEHANVARAAPNLETWHKRLGHVNYTSIIEMAKGGYATGMPADLSTLPAVCEHCILGKQTK